MATDELEDGEPEREWYVFDPSTGERWPASELEPAELIQAWSEGGQLMDADEFDDEFADTASRRRGWESVLAHARRFGYHGSDIPKDDPEITQLAEALRQSAVAAVSPWPGDGPISYIKRAVWGEL